VLLEFVSEFFLHRQELLWLITLMIDLGLALLMYRLFGKMGLYTSVVLSILLANLGGPKLIMIFGYETSMGVIIYSGIYFATDLLSERYGKREAARAVMLGFAASLILVLMISLSLMYQPSPSKDFALRVHQAFLTMFDFTPRFVFGSLLAYLLSQRFDVFMFHYIRSKTGARHLWLRNNGSTMLSQGIDTVLYSLVVWWGVVDLETALSLGAVKYVIKIVIAALDTPFIYWGYRWDTSDQDWADSGGQDEGRVAARD
jgi:uncharacterized integral membrane protein (TIGR00697 family)